MGIFHVLSMLDVQSDNAPANAPINVRSLPANHIPTPRMLGARLCHTLLRIHHKCATPRPCQDSCPEGHCGKVWNGVVLFVCSVGRWDVEEEEGEGLVTMARAEKGWVAAAYLLQLIAAVNACIARPLRCLECSRQARIRASCPGHSLGLPF
jgi:hypothetical protein